MNILRRKIPVLIMMLVFALSLMLMIPGMILAQEEEHYKIIRKRQTLDGILHDYLLNPHEADHES